MFTRFPSVVQYNGVFVSPRPLKIPLLTINTVAAGTPKARHLKYFKAGSLISDNGPTPITRIIGPEANMNSKHCIVPIIMAVRIAVATDADNSSPVFPATNDVDVFNNGSLYNLATEN